MNDEKNGNKDQNAGICDGNKDENTGINERK